MEASKTSERRFIVDDKQIIELYFARDERAITETDIKYRKYCSAIAYGILRDKEDVEEVLNDTYSGAWNSIPPNEPAVLSTYLGKITRNLSLKRVRSANAVKRGGDEFLSAFEEISEIISSDEDMEKEIEAKELSAYINTYLRALPDTERGVFICRYWYFNSISDISKQFGFSQSKVKSMLYRTRNKMFSKLKEEELL